MTETLNSLQSLKYLHSGSLRESFAYPNSEVQGRVSSYSDVRTVLPKDNPDTSKNAREPIQSLLASSGIPKDPGTSPLILQIKEDSNGIRGIDNGQASVEYLC